MDSAKWYNKDKSNVPVPLDEKHSRPPEGISGHLDQTPSNSCKYEVIKIKEASDEVTDLTDDVIVVKSPEEIAVDSYRKIILPILHRMLGLESESEREFVKAVENYKDVLSRHADGLSSRLMKDVISRDILFITANYKRIAIGLKDKFLNIMEQILLTACEVIKNYFETITSISKERTSRIIIAESRRIKILLQDCLLNRCDRIMNVLMKIRVHPDINQHKDLWASIFMYFLVRVFSYKKNDDIATGFIIFQKLIQIRPLEKSSIIEGHMNRMLGRNNLLKIPVVKEMMEKRQSDPLYSIRDLCLIYHRYKSKQNRRKQEDFGGLSLSSRQNVYRNVDMVSRDIESRLRLSRPVFQSQAYSSSPFAQKLPDWKMSDRTSVHEHNYRWGDSYAQPHNNLFGGRELKWCSPKNETVIKKYTAGTPSSVIVIDDDDDDDDVQICTEPNENSHVKTSSENLILIEPNKDADIIIIPDESEPTLNSIKDGENPMEIDENRPKVEVVQESRLIDTSNNQRIEETLPVKDKTETTTRLNGITKTITDPLSDNKKLKENDIDNPESKINTYCPSVPVKSENKTPPINKTEETNKISSELDDLVLYDTTKNNGQNGRRNGQNLLFVSEASKLSAMLYQMQNVISDSKTRDNNGETLPSISDKRSKSADTDIKEPFVEKDPNLYNNGEFSNSDKNSTESIENENPKTPSEDLKCAESNKDSNTVIVSEVNGEPTLNGITSVTNNVEHPMETDDHEAVKENLTDVAVPKVELPQVNIPQEIDRSTISNDSIEKPLSLNASAETTTITSNVFTDYNIEDNTNDIDKSVIPNDSTEETLPVNDNAETVTPCNGLMDDDNIENSTTELIEKDNPKTPSQDSIPVESNKDTDTPNVSEVNGELTLDSITSGNDVEEPMETEDHEAVREDHTDVTIPPSIPEEIDKSITSNDGYYTVSITDTGQEIQKTCSVEEANAETETTCNGLMKTNIEHASDNNNLIEKNCDSSLSQLDRDGHSEPIDTNYVRINQKLFNDRTEELPTDNNIENDEADNGTDEESQDDPASPAFDPFDDSDVKSHFKNFQKSQISDTPVALEEPLIPTNTALLSNNETSSTTDTPQEVAETRAPSDDPFQGPYKNVVDFYVAVGASLNDCDMEKGKTSSENISGFIDPQKDVLPGTDLPKTESIENIRKEILKTTSNDVPNQVPQVTYNELALCNNNFNGGFGKLLDTVPPTDNKNGQFKVPLPKDSPPRRGVVKKASTDSGSTYDPRKPRRSNISNELYQYSIGGPLGKPRPAGNNGFGPFDCWNDESEDDFRIGKEPTPAVPNGGRVSVVSVNQPRAARKSILTRPSSTSKSRHKGPSTNNGRRATIDLPNGDPHIPGEISNEPTLQEKHPTYLNYYNNLYLPNSSSSSSSNVPLETNLNSPVYDHLSYPNPSNLYYDNLQSSSNLFLSQTNSEIDTNHQEKILKTEEFGAIAKTLNDANAVLDQGSVFCTDAEKLNHLNAVLPPPVPEVATNSLFEDQLMPSIRNFVSSEEPAYLSSQSLDNNLSYQHGMDQLHGSKINEDSNVAYHPQTTMYSAPMNAYYPSPVPEVTENVTSQNPQAFLRSTTVQPVSEDTKMLPYKKRKMDKADVKCVLEENISYPAKRQMSIADLHPDFPKIKTLAARKLYPEGTYPYQNYYYPEGYNQYDDYNKRSVMNVYINGLKECSANYPLCLMIGTVHTCMNNSQTPENGQCAEQTPPETPQNYDQNVPLVQSVPNNVQKPSDMSLRQPVYEPKPKRSRKTPTVEGPKRSRGRPRKNVN